MLLNIAFYSNCWRYNRAGYQLNIFTSLSVYKLLASEKILAPPHTARKVTPHGPEI